MGTRRLEALVDDLLDFARIEAGTFRLRLERTDLREAFREIVDSLRPQAEEGRLNLRSRFPSEPVEALVDARRIQQVVTNLLHNAIKFTPPGGDVTVRLEAIDGRREGLRSSDTGPRHRARGSAASSSSASASSSAACAKGGTGLGLAISQLDRRDPWRPHRRGRASPSVGSTFWFTLPRRGALRRRACRPFSSTCSRRCR